MKMSIQYCSPQTVSAVRYGHVLHFRVVFADLDFAEQQAPMWNRNRPQHYADNGWQIPKLVNSLISIRVGHMAMHS